MKLEKAIESLTLENRYPWNKDNSDLRTAVKLGIEALKRIMEIRASDFTQGGTDLPGETEE